MTALIASITFLFLILAFSTHVFGLPANWFIIAILAIWAWLSPDADRSGSVCLNTFARFLSGISAFLTLPVSPAAFVWRKPRQAFSCPTLNAAAFGCTNPYIP
jgi:hypothetical protein